MVRYSFKSNKYGRVNKQKYKFDKYLGYVRVSSASMDFIMPVGLAATTAKDEKKQTKNQNIHNNIAKEKVGKTLLSKTYQPLEFIKNTRGAFFVFLESISST